MSNPQRIVFAVRGLQRPVTLATVEWACLNVPGVTGLDIDLDAGRMTVTYAEQLAPTDALLIALADAGIPVWFVEDPDDST